MHEGTFPVQSAELYSRTVGSGAPLVVLHGGPAFNHHYLLPDLDRLANDFQLIYYDQRGRGRSSRGVDVEDVSIESEVDDLDRLRLHLGLDTLALLGHSWGCLLAMEYAARHAQRVSRLVLMNTAPVSHADFMDWRARRQATEADGMARMSAIASTPEFAAGDPAVEADYYRIYFRLALRDPDQLEHVIRSLRVHFTPDDILKARAIGQGLLEQTWLSPDYDLAARLRALRSPALVIHGEHDFIPVACARHVAEAVAGSRLVVLPGCGHFAYLERPVEVRAAILNGAPPASDGSAGP